MCACLDEEAVSGLLQRWHQEQTYSHSVLWTRLKRGQQHLSRSLWPVLRCWASREELQKHFERLWGFAKAWSPLSVETVLATKEKTSSFLCAKLQNFYIKDCPYRASPCSFRKIIRSLDVAPRRAVKTIELVEDRPSAPKFWLLLRQILSVKMTWIYEACHSLKPRNPKPGRALVN